MPQQPSPQTAASSIPTARTAAFFDLDKTILAKSSTVAFGKQFVGRGLLRRRALLKSGYDELTCLLLGRDRLHRMGVHMTNMCTGWDVAHVRSIVEEMMDEIALPLVFAGAADLIADHKRRGHDVVIVSASAEDIVEPIASTLGATHAMATRLAVEEGKYTGDVAFHCYGERKVHAIRELAAREGYPLEYCYAYSDSISDLPMLEAVGYPSVVNPGRGLRREATQRGWPALTFSRPRNGAPARG